MCFDECLGWFHLKCMYERGCRGYEKEGVCVLLLRLLNYAEYEGGEYWAEEEIRGCKSKRKKVV